VVDDVVVLVPGWVRDVVPPLRQAVVFPLLVRPAAHGFGYGIEDSDRYHLVAEKIPGVTPKPGAVARIGILMYELVGVRGVVVLAENRCTPQKESLAIGNA